jgi:hypothetical protein
VRIVATRPGVAGRPSRLTGFDGNHQRREETHMLYYAAVFLVIALVAVVSGLLRRA